MTLYADIPHDDTDAVAPFTVRGDVNDERPEPADVERDASGFRVIRRADPIDTRPSPVSSRKSRRLAELIAQGWSPCDAALAAHCEARDAGESA